MKHFWEDHKEDHFSAIWLDKGEFWVDLNKLRTSQVTPVVKNPPANAGDKKPVGSIPGSGRSPGGGNGNPLQYPCLENPTDRGPWKATVHGGAKSRT